MSAGRTEQIEKWFSNRSGYVKNGDTRWIKRTKNRRERRRAKKNPECHSHYTRYTGWLY